MRPVEEITAACKRFATLKEIIVSGHSAYIAVGLALEEVRRDRLYKGSHGSFELCCEKEFKLGRQTAYDYLHAVEVYENVRACVHSVPSLAQAREMYVLPAQQQRELAAQVDFSDITVVDLKLKVRQMRVAVAPHLAATIPPFQPTSRAECIDAIDGLRSLSPASVSVVVTSPPYNIGVRYSKYDDHRADYLEWLQAVFIEVKRVTMDNGHFFLQMGGTSVDPLIPYRVLDSALRAEWVLQNEILWVKNVSIGGNSYGHFQPINSEIYLNHTHEFIFHLTLTGAVPIDRLAIGVPFVDSGNVGRWQSNTENIRCRGNTWYIPYETIQDKTGKYNHPAVFPVALPEMCLRLSGVPAGSLVLDPFCGTGSTLIACERLKMQGLGFDFDQKYIDAADIRLAEMADSLGE